MTRWTLLYRLIVRPLLRDRARTGLTIAMVALGVAVVVAIDLSGDAAAGSFRSSLETLAGKADLEVTAIGGVDESVLPRLTALPYPLTIRPRLEDHALIADTGDAVPLIGLDLVALSIQALSENTLEMETGQGGAEAGALAATDLRTSVWAGKKLGFRPGQRVSLTIQDRTAEYVVRGVFSVPSAGGEDRFLVMDIGAAQLALARPGRVDRIEIELPAGTDNRDWEGELRRVLPASATLQPQGTRTDENRKMLASFRWNLRVLSYIALVVGAFLIYNTVSISVVRRRNEIGVVRALGATRRMVLAAFLAEAALIGLAGSLAGLALGRVMAVGAVRLVSVTVEALYITSQPAPIALDVVSALIGLATGLGMALIAALAPAQEAAAVAPVEAMARGRQEFTARLRLGRHLALAATAALLAALASQVPAIGGKPLGGYAAAGLLLVASALVIPAVVQGSARLLPGLVQRSLGVEAGLAYRGLAASLSRTSVLVGALSTAVAMMVSVGIMVGSFRETIVLWMDEQLKADFYLRPAGLPAADRQPTLAPEVADRVEALPEIAAVDRFRLYSISYQGLPASLAGGETKTIRNFRATAFLPGPHNHEVFDLMAGGQDNVIVSEPFAHKHGVEVDEVVRLPLAGRERPFRVVAIYRDYSNERGYIILDRATLLKYLPDPASTNLAVFLKPGVNSEQARAAIQRAVTGRSVLIFAHQALRKEAITIFDRTFAITYALEAVAIVVAVMGMAGALVALVIDRRREFGLLRFLGASRGQVRRLILFEAGILGLLSQVVGIALGVLLSLVLIFVINKQSFGWTIQLHWPVAVVGTALAGVFGATVLAGLFPARTAMQLNPIEVIHEE